MNLRERIIKLIELEEGGNTSAFYRKTGLSTGSLSKITNSAQPKTIKKILDSYPKLNREWLVFEDSDMYGEHIKKKDLPCDNCESLKKENEELKKERDFLRLTILNLTTQKYATRSESDKQTTRH